MARVKATILVNTYSILCKKAETQLMKPVQGPAESLESG